MINYNLICQDCEYEFKSWFASSKEFSKLQKKNLLECIKCESKNVTKGIMAPNISSKLKLEEMSKTSKHCPRLSKSSKRIRTGLNGSENSEDFLDVPKLETTCTHLETLATNSKASHEVLFCENLQKSL